MVNLVNLRSVKGRDSDQVVAMASKERWVEFFTEARIPPGAAKQYAKAFDDNRISTDMLMDLNKV